MTRAPVIHVGNVGDLPVRFLRGTAHPQPDLPSVDLAALLRAVGLGDDDVLHVLHLVKRDWPDLARCVVTEGGIVVAMPIIAARDLLTSLSVAPARLDAFTVEAGAAVAAAARHIATADGRLAWAVAAADRSAY